MTRLHRYRALLFDLDGTLLDSADLIIAAFQETCRVRLQREVGRTTILKSRALPIRERFHALAPDRDEELAQDYLARYLALHDRLARLFPGVPEVLDALAGRGYRLGIVTSKRRATTRASVEAFRLDRWCRVIVADEDVTRHKPDPEPVRTAAELLGVPVSDTLMVGDTALDIAAGRAAGAGTAAALWDPISVRGVLAAEPDHRLHRPEDLLAICLRQTLVRLPRRGD